MGLLRFFRGLKRLGRVHPERAPWRALAVGTALLLVVIGYGAFVHAPRLRRAVVSQWQAQIAATLEYRREALAGWIAAYRSDARTIASFPSVTEGLVAAGAMAVPSVPQHLREVLSRVTAENAYDGLWLFEARARLAAHFGPADTAGRLAALAAFAEGVQAGAPPVAIVAAADGTPLLLVGTPVARTAERLGTVVIQLDPHRSIYRITEMEPVPTTTGQVHLVTQVGDSVVRLTPSRGDRTAPWLVARVPLADSLPSGAALLHERTVGEFIDARGVRVIAATTRVDGTSWAMFSRVDLAEALAAYRDGLWHYATVAFGLLTLLFAATVLVRAWGRQQLAEQQRQNESRLQELAANAGDIIFRFRLHPRIACEFINPAVKGITGFTPEEVYADPLLPGRQVHPADARGLEELLQSPLSSDPLAFRFYHRNGAERVLELLNFPVRGENGELVAVEGVARDVTRIHEQERALRRSEVRHRTLFENLAQGIVYREADAVPLLNPSAREILGVDEADLEARGLEVVTAFEEDATPIPPAEFPGSVALRTGEAVPQRVVRILNRREGRFRWVLVGSRPLPAADGRAAAAYTTLTDITAMREAEDALWGTREMYRALGESSDDVIGRVGADLRILTVNSALTRYTGVQPEDAVGRTFTELGFLGVAAGELEQNVQAVLAAGSPRTGAATVAGPSPHHFNYRISPEYDREGEVVSVVVWAADVTAQRELEAQYQQAQKMEAVGRLAGGVAHDFNNLITAIKGYAAFLLNDLPPDSPARADAAEIDRAADRAARLTRQLLAFSRKQVLELRELRLDVIVRDLESMLRRIIGEDIAMLLNVQPGLWPVLGDAVQVQQVLLNLVVNSRDAMERGGELEIRLRNRTIGRDVAGFIVPPSPGDYVALTVRDSGSGIVPEDLEHIFEPFFTTKEVGRGTGLGLPTVYGIVEQSGGAIRVESAPGVGTTFEILLPRAAEAGAEPAAETFQPDGARAGERVLVVEDEAALRGLIRRMLDSAGYRVTVAESGVQALALADGRGAFDLLLTDVVMPGMQGGELARQFAARFPAARVLFMSGYSEEVVAHHGVLSEHSALLRKPFTQAELEHAVRAALDQVRAP